MRPLLMVWIYRNYVTRLQMPHLSLWILRRPCPSQHQSWAVQDDSMQKEHSGSGTHPALSSVSCSWDLCVEKGAAGTPHSCLAPDDYSKHCLVALVYACFSITLVCGLLRKSLILWVSSSTPRLVMVQQKVAWLQCDFEGSVYRHFPLWTTRYRICPFGSL